MNFVSQLARLVPLTAGAFLAATSLAAAQADPERPVTPPDSYRVVMENDRMRMIEVHIKPRSKVHVDSPANRDRFLYMLTDGALVLAPAGKTPYEFALHAGETAVFPAVSPVVENDTNQAVRALMVEIKQPMRSEAVSKSRGKTRYAGKGKSRTTVVVRSKGKAKQVTVSRAPAKATTSRAATSRPAASSSGPKPLNLGKTNSTKPKVSGKSRGSSS